MNKDDELKFKRHYEQIQDEKIMELLQEGEGGLIEGAYHLLKEEALKRKLITADFTALPKEQNIKKYLDIKGNELGFGLGNLWIVLGFFHGFIALIFGVIIGVQTQYFSGRVEWFLVSFFKIGSAWGIFKRKRYGLILAYVFLGVNIFNGVLMPIFSTKLLEIIQSVFIAGVSILWILYFRKREKMFSATQYDQISLILSIILVLFTFVVTFFFK